MVFKQALRQASQDLFRLLLAWLSLFWNTWNVRSQILQEIPPEFSQPTTNKSNAYPPPSCGNLLGPEYMQKEMLGSGRQGCPNTDAAESMTQYIPANIDPASLPKPDHCQTMPGYCWVWALGCRPRNVDSAGICLLISQSLTSLTWQHPGSGPRPDHQAVPCSGYLHRGRSA